MSAPVVGKDGIVIEFKVGDRVRVIGIDGPGYREVVGQTGRVESIDESTTYQVDVALDSGDYGILRFRKRELGLISPARGEHR